MKYLVCAYWRGSIIIKGMRICNNLREVSQLACQYTNFDIEAGFARVYIFELSKEPIKMKNEEFLRLKREGKNDKHA